MKNNLNIEKIAIELNDDFNRTPEEWALILSRLEEYRQENNLSLVDLREQCWKDSNAIFDYIFA